MDDFHKKRRKLETERNKKRRQESKRAADIIKNPQKLSEEIERLESLDKQGKLDDESKETLRTLKDKKKLQGKNSYSQHDEAISRQLHAKNFAVVDGREVRIGGRNGVPLPPAKTVDENDLPYFVPEEPPKLDPLPPLRKVPSPPLKGIPQPLRMIPPPPPIPPVGFPKPSLPIPPKKINTPLTSGTTIEVEEDKTKHAALIDVSKFLKKNAS